MLVDGTHYRTVWLKDGVMKMIDQPRLPHEFRIVDMATHRDTARAISTMIVRGAGAIGATGAAGAEGGGGDAETSTAEGGGTVDGHDLAADLAAAQAVDTTLDD